MEEKIEPGSVAASKSRTSTNAVKITQSSLSRKSSVLKLASKRKLSISRTNLSEPTSSFQIASNTNTTATTTTTSATTTTAIGVTQTTSDEKSSSKKHKHTDGSSSSSNMIGNIPIERKMGMTNLIALREPINQRELGGKSTSFYAEREVRRYKSSQGEQNTNRVTAASELGKNAFRTATTHVGGGNETRSAQQPPSQISERLIREVRKSTTGTGTTPQTAASSYAYHSMKKVQSSHVPSNKSMPYLKTNTSSCLNNIRIGTTTAAGTKAAKSHSNSHGHSHGHGHGQSHAHGSMTRTFSNLKTHAHTQSQSQGKTNKSLSSKKSSKLPAQHSSNQSHNQAGSSHLSRGSSKHTTTEIIASRKFQTRMENARRRANASNSRSIGAVNAAKSTPLASSSRPGSTATTGGGGGAAQRHHLTQQKSFAAPTRLMKRTSTTAAGAASSSTATTTASRKPTSPTGNAALATTEFINTLTQQKSGTTATPPSRLMKRVSTTLTAPRTTGVSANEFLHNLSQQRSGNVPTRMFKRSSNTMTSSTATAATATAPAKTASKSSAANSAADSFKFRWGARLPPPKSSTIIAKERAATTAASSSTNASRSINGRLTRSHADSSGSRMPSNTRSAVNAAQHSRGRLEGGGNDVRPLYERDCDKHSNYTAKTSQQQLPTLTISDFYSTTTTDTGEPSAQFLNSLWAGSQSSAYDQAQNEAAYAKATEALFKRFLASHSSLTNAATAAVTPTAATPAATTTTAATPSMRDSVYALRKQRLRSCSAHEHFNAIRQGKYESGEVNGDGGGSGAGDAAAAKKTVQLHGNYDFDVTKTMSNQNINHSSTSNRRLGKSKTFLERVIPPNDQDIAKYNKMKIKERRDAIWREWVKNQTEKVTNESKF